MTVIWYITFCWFSGSLKLLVITIIKGSLYMDASSWLRGKHLQSIRRKQLHEEQKKSALKLCSIMILTSVMV